MADETQTADEKAAPEAAPDASDAATTPAEDPKTDAPTGGAANPTGDDAKPDGGSSAAGGKRHTPAPLAAGATAPALIPRLVEKPPGSSLLASFGGVLVLVGLFHLVLFVWPKFIVPTQTALAISIGVGVLALLTCKWTWAAWNFVGKKIGRTMTMVVVTLLYVLVIPFFQFLRSGDPLGKQLGGDPGYWQARDDEKKQDPDVERASMPF